MSLQQGAPSGKILPFVPPKDPLAFSGLGISIDAGKQLEGFEALFTSVQAALVFCNLGSVEAKETARKLIDTNSLGEVRADWDESIAYLEAAIKLLRIARARLEISSDRARRKARDWG